MGRWRVKRVGLPGLGPILECRAGGGRQSRGATRQQAPTGDQGRVRGVPWRV